MIARFAERTPPAEGDPQEHLSGLEWLSRIASILLTAALVLSIGFAFRMATVTREVAGQVDVARTLTDHLRTAQYALATEQSLERQYRLSPEGATFVAHRVAANSLIAALDSVRALSGSNGRSEIDRILAMHRTYLSDTRQLFVATNREQADLVEVIQRDRVDVVFGEIEDAIEARAKVQTADEKRAIVQLREARRWFVDITFALSITGLCCLGCFLLIVRTYRARLESLHEAEVRKLESNALLDGLTGIGNHRAYKQALLREISRAERYGEALTLAILDIDDFKTVNDRDGHIQGDHLLASVATLLGSLRTEDRAFRVGGDEFAIILPHTTLHAAKELIDRLQDAARQVMLGNTLSIGLATLHKSHDGAASLQAQADAAMYAAKRLGRNMVAQYDEARDGKWLLSPTKVHNLRQLIAARSMDVVFQPIWDVRRCRILAYEALSRPDPAYGFQSPQDAFDLAERIGRSHELDAVFRDAALAHAALLPAGVLLFLNISPQSLDHGRLDPAHLVDAVVAAGLTPERIVIEITERAVTQVDVLIAAVLALRNHGFRLALDDTGAGNSGLEMLSRLPLDFVKIDREVVVRALVDRKARGVIAGIIAIARATDAYVIAEGIETKEMLELVCGDMARTEPSQRIQGVQGYLLNRPRETFLARHEAEDTKALLREFTLDSGKIVTR
jgi:diguanylate cyclase (GGDEF)-like protein